MHRWWKLAVGVLSIALAAGLLAFFLPHALGIGWRDTTRMKTRLNEVLMDVGLGSIEKKFPHQLSGGEQQRVVIARALLNEPMILIADEPTGNLDPEVSQGIMKIFQQINKSGTAVLMATHSYGLIKKFPARILKCEDGKVLDSAVEKFELITDY